MAQVKITSKVKHDGSIFEAGDVIGDLTDAQARALVDAGVAEHARGGEQASKGRKQAPRTSKVKESLLGEDGKAKGGARKSVAEKAQERAQGDAKAKKGTNTPPADENAAGGQDAGEDGNQGASQDAGQSSGTSEGNGDAQGDDETKTEVADTFELNGATFSTKQLANGQNKYYKAEGDGKPKEIKKVDYLTAKQEAQG